MEQSAASVMLDEKLTIAKDGQQAAHLLGVYYRAFEQKRLRTHESPPSVPADVRIRCFCRTCRQVKALSEFYPSHIKRTVYRCKQCCRSKSRSHTEVAMSEPPATSNLNSESADNSVPRQPKPMDAAVYMLDRLRRMCARPEASCLRYMLSQHKSIAFDSRVARQVLQFWQWKSALHIDDAASNTVSHCAANSESTRPGGDQREVLRFLPWGPCTTLGSGDGLQPWEVIPLTNVQARWLAGIPPHLWSECMEPGSMEGITRKLRELRQLVLACDGK